MIWARILIVWIVAMGSLGGMAHWQTDSLPLIGFVIDDMTIVYHSWWVSAQQLMREHTGIRAVLNASYFGWWERSFVPAGLFMSGWVQISPFVPPSMDRNLGVLMRWSPWHTPELIDIGDSIDRLVLTWNVVQIWPRLIQDGQINPVLTDSYSHRKRRTRRTFLIQHTIHGKTTTIVWLTKNPVSLDQLARVIQQMCIGTCQAVNLDGGSSTSMRTQTYGFRSTRRLPLRFLIR